MNPSASNEFSYRI